MPTPLLQTKLHIPYEQTDKLLERSRLHDALTCGVTCRLTLVAAPAGFGKTALICNWIHKASRTAAWLSLDEGDNNLTQFLRYVVVALNRAYPEIGQRLIQIVESTEIEVPEPFMAELIHEIEEYTSREQSHESADSLLLVLDDYYFISAEPVHQALRYLLEHMPRSFHLIITTRADPPLPLARMRVRQQLNDIRADALRFLPDELDAFLSQTVGDKLTPESVQQLAARTEGWIAGAQLAGLTIEKLDAQQAEQFVEAFSGSDRYVADYLLEEVLLRQPEDIRSFLLQTSILERLSPALCDAVTQRTNSYQLLHQLETGNYFLIALDHVQEWYRYQHLFLDLLRTQLHFERSDSVSALHKRACDWYAAHDLTADALHHAFAAEDHERAAVLIEMAWRAMDRSFQSATWLSWVKRLPDELIRCRPVLSTGYGWALLDTGQIESAEPRLQDAERWLDSIADTNAADLEAQNSQSDEMDVGKMVVVDKDVFHSLPATIAAARAYQSYALGDLPATEDFAQRALALLPDDDYFYRGIPAVTLGLAYWAGGDLRAAHRSFAEAIGNFQQVGNSLFAISGIAVMAEILVAQGHLREALCTYERAFRLVEEQGASMPLVKANLHRGISEIYLERGERETAIQQLSTSKSLHEQALQQNMGFRYYTTEARITACEGNLDGALSMLNEGERLYRRDRLPNLHPIAAQKVRVWIRQDRLTEAHGWVRERGLSTEDELTYLNEFEYITLARVLIEEQVNAREDALFPPVRELLERLLAAAEAGARKGSVIEISVLLALIHQYQGDIQTALAHLEQALTLATVEGYARIFVDEGEALSPLLRRAASQGVEPQYVASLLTILQAESPNVAVEQPLIEPLSERELELLALVADGLSNQQIADRLIISIGTTKKHMSNILGKLSASNRTEAVRRAQDLSLI